MQAVLSELAATAHECTHGRQRFLKSVKFSFRRSPRVHSEPQRDAAPARRRVLAGRRGGVAPPALSACASTTARRRVAPADGGSAERSLEGDAASCQRTLASHEQPRQHDAVKAPTSRRVNTYASHDCLLLLCPPPTKDGCLGTPLPWLPHLAVQDRPRSAAQQVLVLG